MRWLLVLLLCLPFVHADAQGVFSTQAVVYGVVVGQAVEQLVAPVVSGQDVPLRVSLTYLGSSLVNVTVGKPSDYVNGFNWTVNESGSLILPSESGDNLSWQANLSVQDPSLLFSVLAPYLVVDSETGEGASFYVKQIRIGSENPFTNVTVSTTVRQGYDTYALFESRNGTSVDVTAAYGFVVVSGTASWTGFNLSVKNFTIIGSVTQTVQETLESVVGGARKLFFPTPKNETLPEEGTGGGAVVLEPPVVESPGGFALDTQWRDLSLSTNAVSEIRIEIENTEETEQSFTVDSTMQFIEVLTPEVVVPPNSFNDALVRIHAGPLTGQRYGRVRATERVGKKKKGSPGVKGGWGGCGREHTRAHPLV